MTIYPMLAQYLMQTTLKGQTSDSNEQVSNFLNMECLLFCMT